MALLDFMLKRLPFKRRFYMNFMHLTETFKAFDGNIFVYYIIAINDQFQYRI